MKMKKKIMSIALTIAMLCSMSSMSNVTVFANNLPPSYTSAHTPARNQGNSNLCWAFSVTAVLEANILKNSADYTDEQLAAMIPSGNYDKSKPLSEQIDLFEKALAYYHYNVKTTDPNDPTRGDYADECGSRAYKQGGHSNSPISVLARWSGLSSYDDTTPKNGEPLYYNYSSLEVNNGIPETERYNAVAHLQRVVEIPDNVSNRTEQIKQSIMDCGAAAVGIASISGGYLSSTDDKGNPFTSYFSKDVAGDGGGHAVTIIGWDDNFSKDWFREGTKPQNNGAWLCKNSYGDNWGTNGLFWVSYEESTLQNATAYYLEPPTNYDNNYQYDGVANNWGSSSFQTAAVNVFTANGDEILEAISFYPYSNHDTASEYTVNIYKDFHDFDGISSTGFEGKAFTSTPVCTMSGTTTDSYLTLKLTTPVQLSAGERYAVSVENKYNGYYYYKTDNYINNTGESYLVRLNRDTMDLYNDGNGMQDKSYSGYFAKVGVNPSIKAFTNNLEAYRTKVSYDVSPTYTVTIPDKVTLGNTQTISADNVVINSGKQLNVKLTATSGAENAFTVSNAQGVELNYNITNGDKAVNINDAVLSVNPLTGTDGEATLNFSKPTDAIYSGTYTGTITFTVSIDDI